MAQTLEKSHNKKKNIFFIIMSSCETEFNRGSVEKQFLLKSSFLPFRNDEEGLNQPKLV